MRWAGYALSAGLLCGAGRAGASPDYPAELASALELQRSPSCALCHTAGAVEEGSPSDAAPPGSADTPFARALVARGLWGDDVPSLRAALAAMSDVDSDGDGARDVDELYWGGDPNQRDGPVVPPNAPPSYGCQMSATPASGGPGVATWLVLLILLAGVTQSLPRIFLPSPRPINIDGRQHDTSPVNAGTEGAPCTDASVF